MSRLGRLALVLGVALQTASAPGDETGSEPAACRVPAAGSGASLSVEDLGRDLDGDFDRDFGRDLDRSIARATRFLVQAQDDDGAWRSSTYGALSDGPSLTPLVAKAVLFAPDVPGSEHARRQVRHYLATLGADERGVVDPGSLRLNYPVYTAALTLIALAGRDDEPARAACAAWVELLRAHQLGEVLGWSPGDLAYGGWGYAPQPLERRHHDPLHGPPFDADLSSTLMAVGALRLAGAAVDDPAIERALVFVQRCQNVAPDGSTAAPLLDGGFCMTPTNALQNKAGVAGVDPDGTTRHRSYGSMTADGLRALLRCGLAPDHPRVVAARRWLERHFRADRHPGPFPPERVIESRSAFYYWCWSFAHAMRALGLRTLPAGHAAPAGPDVVQGGPWAAHLARELLRRQAPDGSFRNPSTMMKEDDPLVATPLALAALVLCRWHLPSARSGGCPLGESAARESVRARPTNTTLPPCPLRPTRSCATASGSSASTRCSSRSSRG